MRMSRCFITEDLQLGQSLKLDKANSHYLHTVLRLKVGDKLSLFNGQGGEYHSEIIASHKHSVEIQTHDYLPENHQSPLNLTLVQGIARSEHMSYALQKAVELGVTQIVPVWTARSQGMKGARLEKQSLRWQQITQQAAAQSGRNLLPYISPAITLQDYLAAPRDGVGICPDPYAKQAGLPDFSPKPSDLSVIVGAEGGFSDEERGDIISAGFELVRLGPRVLRTETATLSILALCQAQWGDLLT